MAEQFRFALAAAASAALVLSLGACGDRAAEEAAPATAAEPAPEASTAAAAAAGERTVTVGGAAMYPSKTIVENAVNSKDHTTLVAVVKAAGLVDTRSAAGRSTVFAPTHGAAEKLSKGTVEKLVEPASKQQLTTILTYHVVPGRMTADDVVKAIKAGNGKATLKTAQGGQLTAALDGNKVVITDAKGGKSTVTIPDVMQSNGVIHVVDTVLMPS